MNNETKCTHIIALLLGDYPYTFMPKIMRVDGNEDWLADDCPFNFCPLCGERLKNSAETEQKTDT